MLSIIKSFLKHFREFSEQYARARLEMAKRNGSFLE
jgi:hypothetical protein